jgi:Bacterial transglutaminase-like N-terminal region
MRVAIKPGSPAMSVLFDIVHTTHYRYHQPVRIGEHRVMFRPRGSHDLRVLATDMVVTPQPLDIRLIQDVYSNSVALVLPQSPATELKIECSFSVEHTGTRALDLPLSPEALQYPFAYEAGTTIPVANWPIGRVASFTVTARPARDNCLPT